jgi:hypothetical protein
MNAEFCRGRRLGVERLLCVDFHHVDFHHVAGSRLIVY